MGSTPGIVYVTNKILTFTSTKYALLPFYIIFNIFIEVLVNLLIVYSEYPGINIMDGLKMYFF